MNTFDEILICPVCGAFAKCTTGDKVYGDRIHADRWFYVCRNYPDCDTYVGCHPGTREPLGTMAGADLRFIRRKAHVALDWHWKRGGLTRDEAYEKLASVLGVPLADAHIGSCTVEQCRRIISAFNDMRPWKVPHR